MGIISLYNFKPTITLGNAIYPNSGLAVSAVSNGIFNEEILNNFWKHPVFPNRQCIEKFFRILRNNAIFPVISTPMKKLSKQSEKYCKK